MILADFEYPTYELLEVAELAKSHIHMIMGVLGWIAIPLALLPPIPITWKWVWIRTITITLVVWVVMIQFRSYTFIWSRIVLDVKQENPGYDGTGGNLVVFLFGWIMPFALCLITLSVARIGLIWIRRRKKTMTEQAGADQPATAPVSEPENEIKPQPESEGRPR